MRCPSNLPALLVVLSLLLSGCAKPVARFDPEAPLPERLSALGLLQRTPDALAPVNGVAYDLGMPLFSDYAWKYRTLHLPPGVPAVRGGAGSDAETLAFPVGTFITKTFYYPRSGDALRLTAMPHLEAPDAPLALRDRRLIETRVLVHRATGWDGVAYRWNADGSEALRVRGGALLSLHAEDGRDFDYLIPDANQCGGCHDTDHGSRALAPIGPKPANLAAVRFPDLPGAPDQYARLQALGLVADERRAQPWSTDDPRAYLDANCAHCHSDVGAADTAGLDLRHAAPLAHLGRCKSPVAAGRGSGGRAYDIWPGRPDASILVFRMNQTDPGTMMPELGRSLVHAEGVALIRAWIASMEGSCEQGRML